MLNRGPRLLSPLTLSLSLTLSLPLPLPLPLPLLLRSSNEAMSSRIAAAITPALIGHCTGATWSHCGWFGGSDDDDAKPANKSRFLFDEVLSNIEKAIPAEIRPPELPTEIVHMMADVVEAMALLEDQANDVKGIAERGKAYGEQAHGMIMDRTWLLGLGALYMHQEANRHTQAIAPPLDKEHPLLTDPDEVEDFLSAAKFADASYEGNPSDFAAVIRQRGGAICNGFTPSSILHANFCPEPNAPAFMLSRVPAPPRDADHGAGKTTTLVLVVRGTSTMADVSSDLKVVPQEVRLDPLRHGGRTSGLVHSGMLEGARSIVDSIELHRMLPILKRAANHHHVESGWPWQHHVEATDTELLVVGHSLGAGVASLLSLLLKEELGFERVRCVVFAAPPCMNPELAASAGEAYQLKNIVCADDCIPRASEGNLFRLLASVVRSRNQFLRELGVQIDAVDAVAKSVGKAVADELHVDPLLPEKTPSQQMQEDLKLKSDQEMRSNEQARWEGGVDMTTPSNVYHLQRKLHRDEIGPGGDADAGAAAGAGGGADELYVTDSSDNLTEFYQLVKVPSADARNKGNAGLSIELSSDMVADHGLDRYRNGLESALETRKMLK
mmetsp:Transcript_96267/g.274207  ORF Transcript_96267/g.274207 Transcript_96267/m.274207 type:complete len:612 (+) Transcript_96267:188-2023(+)